MNIPERGLGRGLGSLLSGRSPENSGGRKEELALSQLVPGRLQPRKYFDETALAELASSIRKQGVIQPLIVRRLEGVPVRYEIVAGERRWRAAKLAGLTDVPVIIAEYDDREAMTVALVENLQREDLDPLEEAEALQSLRNAYSLSQEELAAQLGKSRSAVANALRLLQLPEEIREGLGKGLISAGHARAMLSVSDAELCSRLFHAVVDRRLSVRETEAAADHCKRTGELPDTLGGPQRAKPAEAPARRSPKPQILKDLQASLRRSSGTQATITGTEASGRIQIPYSSPDELARILALLGTENGE
ncbi:MAG: ParB/RepB/Spo0J family partition protein [Mailhella sp.]|nr:ParB/RepB/Spo0J family partition protein [Mailhella sp.]